MKASMVRIILITVLASTGAMNICMAQTGSATLPGHEPNFQVKFSEPLAVLNFLNNLSSNAPPTNPFKQLFNSSRFNQQKYQMLIAEFDRLNIDYNYDFPEYPRGEQIGLSTASLLKKELIDSPSIDEFKVSAIGIIPNEKFFELVSLLAEFTPVYREVIYQPNKEKFEQQLANLRNLIASTDMTSYFNVGIKFYNSSWDNSVPFNFVFYPLPSSRGYRATAFANNAESPLPTSSTDYNLLLSLMFHEMFHILYDDESLALQKDIRQWRDSNPSRSSRYAFTLINESLATALGNGYVYERLNGKLIEGRWYGVKYISEMAKKIYPMVKEYAEKQQSIDRAFIDNFIKIFDDNFSEWLLDPEFIMPGRYVLSDNAEDFKIIDQKFRYRPSAEYLEGISESSIEKMAKAPTTRVIFVSKDNKKKLQLIKQGFAELKDWKPDAKTDFTYSVLLKDKAYLIVINSVRKTAKEQIETLKLKQ
ncbi:MAG TPA: hypothetical protein VGQ72_08410 [Pyrinomonadaceae bacterium]|jgi:hypothetical protein|nr:hypothetical protein [Pyrinomonadaceae bacterium]